MPGFLEKAETEDKEGQRRRKTACSRKRKRRINEVGKHKNGLYHIAKDKLKEGKEKP